MVDERWTISRGLSFVAGLATAVVFTLVVLVAWSPHEDAAMLFAYSENVAQGFGIVFNPGGPHVDGASDLLYMLLVAAAVRVGLSTTVAATLVNAAGVFVVFVSVRYAWVRFAQVNSFYTYFPPVIVCFSALLAISVAGFGLAFFAGLAAALTMQALRYSENRRALDGILLGALVGLAGLDRVEGFVLGALVTLALAVSVRALRLVLLPGLVAAAIAVVFLLWRWSYFGYPFPNPFYKKGGGAIYLDSVPPSVINLVLAALPWIVILAAGLFTASRRRSLATLLILGGGWALLWMGLSNETNFLGRFQFPVVPALSMLSASVFPDVRAKLGSGRVSVRVVAGVTALVAVVATAGSLLIPNLMIIRNEISENGLHESLALALQPHSGQPPRTLAVTEAGYAAWKSDWYVIDLWGLNDKRIAHGGYLGVEELRTLAPDLIFAHVPAGPDSEDPHAGLPQFLVEWERMTDPLMCFTSEAGYRLMGLWQRSKDDSFVLFARTDLPDLAEIAESTHRLAGAPSDNRVSLGSPPRPTDCPE